MCLFNVRTLDEKFVCRLWRCRYLQKRGDTTTDDDDDVPTASSSRRPRFDINSSNNRVSGGESSESDHSRSSSLDRQEARSQLTPLAGGTSARRTQTLKTVSHMYALAPQFVVLRTYGQRVLAQSLQFGSVRATGVSQLHVTLLSLCVAGEELAQHGSAERDLRGV